MPLISNPELHIFTGIFNHIYDAMVADPDLCDYVESWSKDVGVTRRFCPGTILKMTSAKFS